MSLLLALLLGCGDCPPLSEVAVSGGDEARRTAIEEELARIEGELALPVCIAHVSLLELMHDNRNGTYNPVTHRVRLQRDLDLEELPSTLRHEICHGIDVQNKLVDGREALFSYPLVPPPVREGRMANEAFADTCERGGEALSALWAQDCPDDPDLRAAQIVRTEVFGADDPEPGARYEPIACATLPQPLFSDIERLVFTMPQDGPLWISIYGDPIPVHAEVDPLTGEWLGEGRPELPTTEEAWPARPPGWEGPRGGALDEDRSASFATLWLQPQGDVMRMHARAGDLWLPADGPCPNGTERFFTVAGELWMGMANGRQQICWGRWTEAL